MSIGTLKKEIILFLAKDGSRPANYDAIAHHVRQYRQDHIESAYNAVIGEGLAIEVRWGRVERDEFGLRLTGAGRSRARYIKLQREDR